MKNREKHKGEGMRKDIYRVGRGKERERKKIDKECCKGKNERLRLTHDKEEKRISQ